MIPKLEVPMIGAHMVDMALVVQDSGLRVFPKKFLSEELGRFPYKGLCFRVGVFPVVDRGNPASP